MEDELKKYFVFEGKDSPNKLNIINELNPIEILKITIPKYLDNRLNKNIEKDFFTKLKFEIDYDLYKKITSNQDFGEIFNSKIYYDLVNEFVIKIMEEHKLPYRAQYNPIIYKLYKYWNLYDKENKIIKFSSGIKMDYGIFLYNLIISNKFTKTLEVGFAYGSSAMFICSALKNLESIGLKTVHYAVDPNQSTQWQNIGKLNVERISYKNLKLYEEPDYTGLPKILKEKLSNAQWLGSKYDDKYEKFNLIFIDGWHTFDYTLLDFFYADLLLEVGGYIIVDDAKFDALKELDKYLSSNYKFYQKVNYEMSLFLVYKKLRNDDRSWNFHVNFIK